jgi:hypothetical protein
LFNEIIGEDADEDTPFVGEGVVAGGEGVVAGDDKLFSNELGDEFGEDEGDSADEIVVEDVQMYLV